MISAVWRQESECPLHITLSLQCDVCMALREKVQGQWHICEAVKPLSTSLSIFLKILCRLSSFLPMQPWKHD